MDAIVWIVSGVGAAGFRPAGLKNATRPMDALRARLARGEGCSPGTVKLNGVAGLRGAIGLVRPLLTGVIAGAFVAVARVGAL